MEEQEQELNSAIVVEVLQIFKNLVVRVAKEVCRYKVYGRKEKENAG